MDEPLSSRVWSTFVISISIHVHHAQTRAHETLLRHTYIQSNYLLLISHAHAFSRPQVTNGVASCSLLDNFELPPRVVLRSVTDEHNRRAFGIELPDKARIWRLEIVATINFDDGPDRLPGGTEQRRTL